MIQDAGPSKKRHSFLSAVRRRPLWMASGALLVALALFLFGFPIALRWGLERWLESHGRLEAEIENVDFNLLTGNMVIHSLVTERQGEEALQWVRASFEIAWRPIFRKRLRLDDIRVRDAVISVVETPDGALYVGGLRVRRARDAPRPKPTEDEGGWEVGFGDIDLNSIRVRFRTPSINREAFIHEAHMDPMQSWNPRSEGRFSILMYLDKGILDVQGSARLYSQNRQVIGRINADELPLGWIDPFFGQVEKVTGIVDAEADFALTWDHNRLNAGYQGRLSGHGLSGEIQQVRLEPMGLDWDGAAVYTAITGQLPQVSVKGRLLAENVNLVLTGPSLKAVARTINLDGKFDQKASGALTWNGKGSLDEVLVTKISGEPLEFEAREVLAESFTITKDQERIEIEGSLATEGFSGVLAQVRWSPTALRWQGTARVIQSRPVELTIAGILAGENIDLKLPGNDMKFVAQGIALEGNFSQSGGEFAFEGNSRTSGTHMTRGEEDGLRFAVEEMALGPLKVAAKESGLVVQGPARLERLSGETPQGVLSPMRVHWQGSARLVREPDQALQISADGALSADDFSLALHRANLTLSADTVSLSGQLGRNANEEIIQYKGEGRVETVRLFETGGSKSLAAGGRLTFEEIIITPETVRIAATRLENFKVLERTVDGTMQMPFAFTAEDVNLAFLTISPLQHHVHVQKVDIAGSEGEVFRNKKGRIAGLPSSNEASQNSKRPSWTYSVDQVELGNGGQLRFVDQSVAPHVELRFNGLSLQVRNINSADSGQSSQIKLESKVGKYAGLQFSGNLNPFSPEVGMDLNGELKQFSLTQIRAYLERYLGYTARSGQLDADFHLQATRGELDSTIKLHMVNLNLLRLTTEEQDEFTRELGMPLNAALNLLRNRDGSVSMTLPVTGELNRPDLAYTEAIAKAVQNATFKAIKTAAISYFAPLGAAYVATKLFGKIVALRLDPVMFRPGQVELDARQRAYLDKVIDKIADRPKLNLLLCGRAVLSERRYFRRIQPRDGSKAGNQDTSIGDAESILLTVAEKRAESVRSYLISKGISSERLVFCRPEITESDSASPKVELSI